MPVPKPSTMRTAVLAIFIAIASLTAAQTVLFSEDFESTPDFTLNTTDAGSAVGTWNTWLINDSYTGGDGDVVCFGFPFTYSIVNTPAQPVGITNPNGNYLHTASVEGIADGITCCSFGAADGFCISADNIFSRMNVDVSTLGSSSVDLKFWWLCEGGPSYYGQVYYSTNGGGSWTNAGGQYNSQGSWTEQTVSLPAFANQATLRFGFRFVNSTGTTALDPGFGIDDVRIVSNVAAPPSITTSNLSGAAFCQGVQLSVPYNITGAYTPGNVFTAQLSDATGSFASPTDIGSVISTTGGSITAAIPVAAAPGTGYRIRVVSTAPVVIGSDNGIDLTINAAPYAGPDGIVTLCKNSGTYDLLDYMTGASGCGAWTGPNAQPFSGQLDTYTDPGGVYTYDTNCPGGCPQDQATLTVTLLNPANAGLDVSAALCTGGANPPLVGYVNGGDATGIFFYNGQPTTNAILANAGSYNLIYVVYGTAPCTNDTSEFLFTVNEAPDAGASVTVTLCCTDPAVQLFTFLDGDPDTGGTWSNPGGSAFSGVFIPCVSAPGLYQYEVSGIPPCQDDQAFVAVIVEPCSGIEESSANAPFGYLGQQGTEHLIDVRVASLNGIEVRDALGALRATRAGPFGSGVVRLDLANLATGAYFLRPVGDSNATGLRIMHIGR